MSQIMQTARKIISNVETVVVGKRRRVVLSVAALFCEGHILLEDVPGVAKTVLARALAGSIGCSFKRVQCTPDLLPTDVTGTSIFNQKTSEFEFRPGPVFANLVLADEINRATPRTQSALLEAMAEGRVTVDGVTHDLVRPFLVIATQNPVDHEGTFPLPEAQLDRFFMKFSLGYPNQKDEMRMLGVLQRGHPLDRLKPVVSAQEVIECQKAVRTIQVDEKIVHYITSIVQGTRNHEELVLGGSPRASIALYRAGQAIAAIQGRDFVMPDDIKQIVAPVLVHRVIVRPESRLRKVSAATIIEDVVDMVPVPMHQSKDRDDMFSR